ncbi:transmembrane protein, putative (macronuclear) [Tetrahymena thermophila SB210]|uniref:Transmembrane protein, putative n=1 Tax=Tetrahymena thermophila (strain SB210) TaxID=312017 RepID=I7MKD5_TETTS|nr:transmembrane protein, putative [Tetrahymena thermophila SB210]EAR98218.2 transmembrane protein, putative [Tetrahymena thermophila SB210]|eukprot:XP_001018463.2 transmembrane protein, putative [Tetrahymena thermophila SB210]
MIEIKEFFKQQHVKHYMWTEIQGLLAFVIINYLLFGTTSAVGQIYFCIPVLFLYMIFQLSLCWTPNYNSRFIFNMSSCSIFTICLPTFIWFYMNVFSPLIFLELKQVENCTASGILKTSLDGIEAYSLLYVEYTQEGHSYLGSACLTNQFQANYYNLVSPFRFYRYNDTFDCGPGIVDYPITKTNNKNQFQQDFNGQSLNQNFDITNGAQSQIVISPKNEYHRNSNQTTSYNNKYGYRYHPYPYYGESSYGMCLQNYTFSKVKIPTWMCGQDTQDFEILTKPKTCYVLYYNQDKNLAQQNAQNYLNQREQNELAVISFDQNIYYPKRVFTYIIIFLYYPLILSLNSFFQYSTDWAFEKVSKSRQEQQNNIIDSNSQSNKNLEMGLIENQQP